MHCLAHLQTCRGPAVISFTRYPQSGTAAVMLYSDDPGGDPIACLSQEIPSAASWLRPAEFFANTDPSAAAVFADVLATELVCLTGTSLQYGGTLVPVCAVSGALLERLIALASEPQTTA